MRYIALCALRRPWLSVRHRVQAILGDVEIQRAHLVRAEILHTLHDLREIVARVRGDHGLLHVVRLLHGPLVEQQRSSTGSRCFAGSKPSRLPSRKRAVLRMRRYASETRLRISSDTRHLVAVIGRRDPQAQDVRAERLRSTFCGSMHVAERLRHLAALRIDREAVRQHFVVRRVAVHRDARSAARTGTSRDAGRSLPGTSPCRPACALQIRAADRARRNG